MKHAGDDDSCFVLGGLKVMNGEFTVGMLVAYQTLVASFTRPLAASLTSVRPTLQELEADMNRLDDVLRYPQDAQYARIAAAENDDRAALKLSGKVELRNITFGYSPLETPLIEDFNLVVKPGQRVALVGGERQRQVDGRQAGLRSLRALGGRGPLRRRPARTRLPRRLITNSVAVVDQEVFLFGGTITENIAMWDSTLPPARIMTACRDAAIAEVIEAREGRYDAVLEEGGENISGGQRQRLEIARALAGEPTIVVLDEATSALDPATEAIIDESLRRRGCTCIIIAHRLSTIRDADEIIVMQRGKVVQEGTHDSMKDIPGPYQELISH